MKTAVVSLKIPAKKRIEKKLLEAGFVISKKDPQIVFAYGGDGTILHAERLYPSIPKVALRGSTTSKTRFYDENALEKIIRLIKEKKYEIREYAKIEANYEGKKIDALNEIQLHNRHPFMAIRFNVYINGILKHENIIGDGMLVSAPFGSTAYYYSTGGKPFKTGLGIGFINPHERTASYVARDDTSVEIELKRGKALLIRDNDKEMIPVSPKDKISIKKSSNVARFLRFPGL